MVAYRVLAFAAVFALILPSFAPAQTRQQRIDEVVRAMDAMDMPILRNELIPAQMRKKASDELERAGKRFDLGLEWKPGNPYWEHAAAALSKDFDASLHRLVERDTQREAAFRQVLDALLDTQLDEVLRFYRSAALRKATLLADATMAMLAWGMGLGANEPDAWMKQRLESLKKEIESYKLTAQEEWELDSAMASAGIKHVMQHGQAGAQLALNNPAAMPQVSATPETLRDVGQLIAQFRDAHIVLPAPAPSDPNLVTDETK